MAPFREDPRLRDLHVALLEIVSVINRPKPDERLIHESGIALERALFPLLIGVDRFGPIGVVELADRAGRDYTTVSRQVARLVVLGLVERRVGSVDRRRHLISVTPTGRAIARRVSQAREKMARALFASWRPREVQEFARLTRRFANGIREERSGPGLS